LLGNHGLGDSIGDSGYPQHSGPTAMRFRYFHCPHRRRKVGPRRHSIPDPVQIVLQILLKILDGLPVHTCGALLRLDALVRLPHSSLRYLKRLVCRIRLTHSSPPRNPLVARVTKSRMSQPLRSAPITGASSLLRAGPPARSHRYSTPHSFCCSTHSLSHPPNDHGQEQYQHAPSHVLRRSRSSGSRRLHAGHRLANKRSPARLIPGSH